MLYAYQRLMVKSDPGEIFIAHRIVDRGFTDNYEFALQTLRASLRQVAGIRCRGHSVVLRAAPA